MLHVRPAEVIDDKIQGMAGAILSLVMLGGVHALLASRSEQPILTMLNIETLAFLPFSAIGAILLGGMVLGGLGSLASVGKHSR